MIEAGSSSRNITELNKTRGRKSKVTGEQVREADHILQDDDLMLEGKRYEGKRYEGKRYTWDQIALEVNAEVVGRTMHRILQAALDYEKCLACVKGWLKDVPMECRMEFARVMLKKSANY